MWSVDFCVCLMFSSPLACLSLLGSCGIGLDWSWGCLHPDCCGQMVFCWAGSSISISVCLRSIPLNVNIQKQFDSSYPLSTVIAVALLPHLNAIRPKFLVWLSDAIESGKPWRRTMWETKSLANSGASVVFEQGMKWHILLIRSTNTRIESMPHCRDPRSKSNNSWRVVM
jgi:hypothetical protein